jgi:hypothetical protein
MSLWPRFDQTPQIPPAPSSGEARARQASLQPRRALPALSLSGGGSVYTRIDPKFSSVNEDDIPSKQLIRLCPGPWALTLPGTWETIPVTVLLVSDETLPGVS